MPRALDEKLQCTSHQPSVLCRDALTSKVSAEGLSLGWEEMELEFELGMELELTRVGVCFGLGFGRVRIEVELGRVVVMPGIRIGKSWDWGWK